MELTMQEEEAKVPIYVEVALKSESCESIEDIRDCVLEYLQGRTSVYKTGKCDIASNPYLSEHVDCVYICEPDPEITQNVPFWRGDPKIYVYELNTDGVAADEFDEDDAEAVTAYSQWYLPAAEFHGLWNTLVFDSTIKNRLLNYAVMALEFADRGVDKNLIAWNRVALLHGPPGTGKTSLCKALAHKLAIRLHDRFPNAHLLEINAHSLFSKWFSESGKLVQKLFAHIQEMIEDDEALICVLIDEVESLTSARQAAIKGSEPSDAVRVVNALLTQIDALRSRDNVIVLTTSNLTEAIDNAFVDRADIKQYIGLPSHRARYEILKSCVEELMRCGLVTLPPAQQNEFQTVLLPFEEVEPQYQELKRQNQNGDSHTQFPISSNQTPHTSQAAPQDQNASPSVWLCAAAEQAEGLSGRSLRKLPFQTHAFFVKKPSTSLDHYLSCMIRAVRAEQKHRDEFNATTQTGKLLEQS